MKRPAPSFPRPLSSFYAHLCVSYIRCYVSHWALGLGGGGGSSAAPSLNGSNFVFAL